MIIHFSFYPGVLGTNRPNGPDIAAQVPFSFLTSSGDSIYQAFLILSKLREYYIDKDTEKHLQNEDNHEILEMYSDRALMMRESLRFDPKVRQCLNKIWTVSDANHNGEITDTEYVVGIIGWFRLMTA